MNPLEIDKVVSRMTDLLRAPNEGGGLPLADNNDLEHLGQVSLALVNDVHAEISAREDRNQSRLAEILNKLDAEEVRHQQLEERISQASSGVLEAELWVARLTDAIKTKFDLLDKAPSVRTAA